MNVIEQLKARTHHFNILAHFLDINERAREHVKLDVSREHLRLQIVVVDAVVAALSACEQNDNLSGVRAERIVAHGVVDGPQRIDMLHKSALICYD